MVTGGGVRFGDRGGGQVLGTGRAGGIRHRGDSDKLRTDQRGPSSSSASVEVQTLRLLVSKLAGPLARRTILQLVIIKEAGAARGFTHLIQRGKRRRPAKHTSSNMITERLRYNTHDFSYHSKPRTRNDGTDVTTASIPNC